MRHYITRKGAKIEVTEEQLEQYRLIYETKMNVGEIVEGKNT